MSLPQVKQGLKFNGLTDYVQCGSPIDLVTAGTICATFQTSVQKPYLAIAGNIDYGVDRNGYFIGIVSGQLEFEIGSASSLERLFASSNLNDGFKHFVCATWDSTNVRIYIDGVKLIDTAQTVIVGNGVYNFTIGKGNGYAPSQYGGSIFDVRLYNRALTADEVTANYNGHVTRNGLVGEWLLNEGTGTVATDTSGNGNNGTINGATWIIKKAPVKGKKNLIPNNDMVVWDATYRYAVVNLKGGKTYTISSSRALDTIVRRVSTGVDVVGQSLPVTFTAPADDSYNIFVRIPTVTWSGTNSPLDISLQLEQNAVPTVYAPYVPVPDNKPMPQKPKKNMLPPFSQWTLHANAVATSDYSLTLNATATTQASYLDIPVIQNTQYTINLGTFQTNQKAFVYMLDASKADIGSTVINTAGGSNTFTTPVNTAYVRVSLQNTAAGQFTFTNPQLELGSVATSFENYKLISDVKLVPLVPKKNMVPDFSQWVLHANAIANSMDKYKLSLNATAVDQNSDSPYIPVAPNTVYTLNGVFTGGMKLFQYDSSKGFLSTLNVSGSSLTLTTSSLTAYVIVRVYSPTAGFFTFESTQLEKGAVATPFESYKLVPDVKHI